MPQVSLRPCKPDGTTIGSLIPLEAISFDETRKAKLKTYTRVQAFSDVSLILGAYNRAFDLSVAIPQDFGHLEDVEHLLAALQIQDQILVDAEGYGYQVRVTNVSDAHLGGQPTYYTADLSTVAINNVKTLQVTYPDITTEIAVTTASGLNTTNDIPMTFFANGRFWVFYSGLGNYVYYQTSTDGHIWSTPTLVSSSFQLNGYGGGVLYYPNLNRFYYGFYNTSLKYFYWRWGMPNADGTITWGISEQSIDTPYAYVWPTFDVDSSGNFWAATLYGPPLSGGEKDWTIWENGVLNFTITQSAVDFSWTAPPKLLVSKSSDSRLCFFGRELVNQSTLYYTTNGGTSWGSFNMSRVFNQMVGDAVIIGNTAYIVYPENDNGTGNVYFVTYDIGDIGTSSEQTLGTIPVGPYLCPGVSISTDQSQTLVVIWTDDVSNIYRTVSYDLGATWDSPKVMLATNGFGYPPTSVYDLTSDNQVVTLAYLGPYNGIGYPLFAGGATFS